MLVLTRRISEKLVIGDDIIITITGIKGKQVRIGIDAPEHVHILRDELMKRDKIDNRKKAKKSQQAIDS